MDSRLKPNAFGATLHSRRFLVALALLFLNDFFLKTAFPNWFTGKLSDFAGLFAFGTFVTSIYPKYRRETMVGIALFFIWWKSPFSQGTIDFVNTILPVTVRRQVDMTDLLALVVLPFAAREHYTKIAISRPLTTILLSSLSIFLFCATTITNDSFDYNTGYYFRQTVPDLLREFDSLSILADTDFKQKNTFTWPGDTTHEYYEYYGSYKLHPDSIFEATLHSLVRNDGSHSMLELHQITVRHTFGIEVTRSSLKRQFESQVIGRLPGFLRSQKLWHLPSFRPRPFDFIFWPFGLTSLVLIAFAINRVRKKKTPTMGTWILYIFSAAGLVFLVGYLVSVISICD